MLSKWYYTKWRCHDGYNDCYSKYHCFDCRYFYYKDLISIKIKRYYKSIQLMLILLIKRKEK